MEKIDPRIVIWNTLHDGEITVVGLEGKDTLVMFVSIPYLRARIRPLGDSFVLRLLGFRRLELADLGGKITGTQLSDVVMRGIEISSAESDAMPVKISTTSGYLTLDFDEIEITLDTGQAIAYENVLQVCTQYWGEWEAQAKRLQEK